MVDMTYWVEKTRIATRGIDTTLTSIRLPYSCVRGPQSAYTSNTKGKQIQIDPADRTPRETLE